MAGDDGHPVDRPPAEACCRSGPGPRASPCPARCVRRRRSDRRPGRAGPGGAGGGGSSWSRRRRRRGGTTRGRAAPGARSRIRSPGPACRWCGAPRSRCATRTLRSCDAERAGKELVERAVDGGGQDAEGEGVGDREEVRRQEVARGQVSRVATSPPAARRSQSSAAAKCSAGSRKGGGWAGPAIGRRRGGAGGVIPAILLGRANGRRLEKCPSPSDVNPPGAVAKW